MEVVLQTSHGGSTGLRCLSVYDESRSLKEDITLVEKNYENCEDVGTCYIEVTYDDKECLNRHMVLQSSHIPRKLLLDQDRLIPEVRDSKQFSYFEITEASDLCNPLTCTRRPSRDKLNVYISELRTRNACGVKHGIRLDYGMFDLKDLRVFEEYQIKDDVLSESKWFHQQHYAKPKCNLEIDEKAISRFQQWLLNFGAEEVICVQGSLSLKTHEIADLACDRWINGSLVNYFVNLIQMNNPQTYIINFAVVTDLEIEVYGIRKHFRNHISNGQIIFVSHVGLDPGCDETFMSNKHLLTSHYAFGLFLFGDYKLRYADTLGLKIPSEFIEKVTYILSHFDVEPTYHYCHDPRGTLIEDEERFISHNCTQYCSKYYPVQNCTNVCGVAILVGMCIAAESSTDFLGMCKAGDQYCARFRYLRNISDYSHFLRLVLMQYIVKSCIDLKVISSTCDETHLGKDDSSLSYIHGTSSGQLNQLRRKNVMNINGLSDLIQDAVLKYTKSRDKPVMQLICRIKSSGKCVTKCFPCSHLGQDDKDCVASIQSFLNTSNCRDWLSSYVNEAYPEIKAGTESNLIPKNSQVQSYVQNPKDGDPSVNMIDGPVVCKNSLCGITSPEPTRQIRRKNHLDISNVSSLVCDAKLKFVKIKGKPALQLGCIIKANGKSVTKSFPCTSRGQDDADCVARIQKFIDSNCCVEWISSYVKVMKNQIYEGRCMKISYRKNVLDIKNVSHLVFDARVKFIKSRGKSCVQLLCKIRPDGRLVSKLLPKVLHDQSNLESVAMVQKFINSVNCETWLRNSLSKNILDIGNINDLVENARLKYFRVKGNPVVQLLCQLKSARRIVKKTFAFSTKGIGDTESVSEIQKYINSNSCISWLNKCRSRITSNIVSLDISSIFYLVGDAKLKFQMINDKPTMQLICILKDVKKSVSKNFPCSSLGPEDSECFARIQEYVKSADCTAWLHRHVMRSPEIDLEVDHKSQNSISGDLELPGLSVDENHTTGTEPYAAMKMELDSGEKVEELKGSGVKTLLTNTLTKVKSLKQSVQVEVAPELLDLMGSHAGGKYDNILSKQLDLKNICGLVDYVRFKAIKVNDKVKICLLFRARCNRKLLKSYILLSEHFQDPGELMEKVQNYINGKKFLKWLSRSTKNLHRKTTLDIRNISDIVEHAWIRYVKSKGKSLVYLVCRSKCSRKLIKKSFPCSTLKKDYVKCMKEIQTFVDSSSCRTWLNLYNSKGDYNIKRIEQKPKSSPDAINAKVTKVMCTASASGSLVNKLNIENVSSLVHSAKLKCIRVKEKPMLQLVCHLRCSKKPVAKYFPCSGMGESYSSCVIEVQNFLYSKDALKWLHECMEKHTLLAREATNGNDSFSIESFSRTSSVQKLGSAHPPVQTANRIELDCQREIHLPDRKKLNLESICHLICNAKLLFVNIKERPLLQLLCHIKFTGKLVIKSFFCSSLGLDDKECLARIQDFINSDDCLKWLDKCTDISPRNLLSSNGPYYRYIVGKPEINFIKPNTLRLVCHLTNGRTKCKAFRCNSKGRKDTVAMRTIDDFVKSEFFMKWLSNESIINKSGGNWDFFRYVDTGIDTKQFVESIPFDLNQSFILNKKGNYKVIIHRNDQSSKESLVKNPLWGTSHRLDDTYSVISGPLKKSTVAVCLFLSCASKTGECRTECGMQIKNVHILDNSLSCCGHILKDYHCTNCYTSTTPQWCRKKDNIVLCKNCDIYFRNHGTDRPNHLWKESLTTNFKHLKCKWKLKFVLRSDDMSRWHVYRSFHNSESHNHVVQDRKRQCSIIKKSNLGTVKEVDKVKKICVTRKQKKSEQFKESFCKSPQVQESNVSDPKVMENIKQELYQVESSEDRTHYFDAYEDYVQDVGVITSEEVGVTLEDPKPQYDDEEAISSVHLEQMKIEKSEIVNESQEIKATMVCVQCIQGSAQEIFCCSSKIELNEHIIKCHKEEQFACGPCYTKSNVLVTFHSESLFEEHMKLHSSKK